MKSGKCVKGIFQCDIFPSSNLKKQEDFKFYNGEESRLNSLYAVKNMQDKPQDHKDRDVLKSFYLKKSTNGGSERKSPVLLSKEEKKCGKHVNGIVNRLEESNEKLHVDRCEKPLVDFTRANDTGISELDKLINVYFPNIQKETEEEQCSVKEKVSSVKELVGSVKERGKENITYGDYVDIDYLESLKVKTQSDVGNSSLNADNKGDDKMPLADKKVDNNIDTEPLYDDILNNSSALHESTVANPQRNSIIFKKRKPPNKPPRIFSNTSSASTPPTSPTNTTDRNETSPNQLNNMKTDCNGSSPNQLSNRKTDCNVTSPNQLNNRKPHCNGTSPIQLNGVACKHSVDRKSCTSCNCDFSEHDVSYNEIVNTRKMAKMNMHDVNENIIENENHQYLWVPPGLNDQLIEEYMTCLPLEKVPHFDNPEGIKYYNKQLIHQLPLQDSNIENIQTLTQREGHYVDAFKRERNPEMSTGEVRQADEILTCNNCNDDIHVDEVYVHGNAFGADAAWHPGCFACCTCDELLVNLIYCFRNKQIYCTRHHAEQIKPRCHACDELIFCGEYIRTEEKAYHSQHFVCVSCDRGLSGEQHLLDEGLPICIQCYDQKFANTCHMCNQTIGVDEDDVMYDEEHWHDYCLVCYLCKCKLSGTSFVVKDANFLCSECFQKTDDKRCNVCGSGFEPGAKRLELKGEYWHDTCFVCDVCKDPITSKKFIHHEGKQVCCPCFDAQFAKRCDRCKQILREGGVACGGAFYHRDCFVCENCDASIANQAFQQKDGQRYCTPCYKQMYAKTCTGCGDYIVNGEFYTVESDNWHKNCFKCVMCDEILRQQTFVQENGKIKLICENCL